MMSFAKIFPYYILWHYTLAFKDIKHIHKSFLIFTFDFFSIGLLLKTLFSPWRRLHEEVERGASKDAETIFGNLLVNFIMRIVGFFVRITAIIVGLLSFVFVLLAGVVFYVIWLVLPFLVVAGFLTGIGFLFK